MRGAMNYVAEYEGGPWHGTSEELAERPEWWPVTRIVDLLGTSVTGYGAPGSARYHLTEQRRIVENVTFVLYRWGDTAQG